MKMAPAVESDSISCFWICLATMEGTAILAAIRSSRTLKRTPVIVLSSAISPTNREAVKKIGVARHLIKPPDLDEFLQIGQTARDVLLEYQSQDEGQGSA
jgi:CheY-like chemotaxis protein